MSWACLDSTFESMKPVTCSAGMHVILEVTAIISFCCHWFGSRGEMTLNEFCTFFPSDSLYIIKPPLSQSSRMILYWKLYWVWSSFVDVDWLAATDGQFWLDGLKDGNWKIKLIMTETTPPPITLIMNETILFFSFCSIPSRCFCYFLFIFN